jgi:hypothetical protein
MTKVKIMGVKTGLSDEVEDIIIQVLGHKERHNLARSFIPFFDFFCVCC